MSSSYITEPVTNGKVLLKTTLGELDVELWSKEMPVACRNFVQLCLEGYYNNSPFDRVIPQFMAQTGGSTNGEEDRSIYGPTFPDEFHSRIKFNHPGQVAMASDPEKEDSNCTQFFFTLGPCEWLNKKHTIFGKITGNTIYNALRFNEVETDSEDKPLEPIRIISTEVISNPFPDIVPRKLKSPAEKLAEKKEQEEKLRKQKIAKRNFNLISIDEGDISQDAGSDFVMPVSQGKVKRQKQMKTTEKKATPQASLPEGAKEAVTAFDGHEKSLKEKKEKREEKKKSKKSKKKSKKEAEKRNDQKKTQKRDAITEYRELLQKARDISNKRGRTSKELEIKAEADDKLISDYSRRRHEYLKLNRANKSSQEETLKMLEKFKQKLNKAKRIKPVEKPDVSAVKEASNFTLKEYRGGIGENPHEKDDEEEAADDESWMTAKLSFRRHIDDDYKKSQFEMKVDDYTVYDPRKRLTES